jgi:hypothetical protein
MINLLVTLQCVVQVNVLSKFLFDTLGSVANKLVIGVKRCWYGITGVGYVTIQIDTLAVKLRRLERQLDVVRREHDLCKSQKELLLLHLQEICSNVKLQQHYFSVPAFAGKLTDSFPEERLPEDSCSDMEVIEVVPL